MMKFTPAVLPKLIAAITEAIAHNAEDITALDQAIGDGDHVINMQRGLHALMAQCDDLSQLDDWFTAWQRIGMTLLTAVGGASGSLYGTLFLSLGKAKATSEAPLTLATFAELFSQAVEAVKQRGKATAGEKTMLDVLIPVAGALQTAAHDELALAAVLEKVAQVALAGMESTRDMIATKGRASFLGERTRGHIDAGAKTSQLMICAIVTVLAEQVA